MSPFNINYFYQIIVLFRTGSTIICVFNIAILWLMKENKNTRVASKNDLQEGNLLKVEVRGKELVLSMVDGKIFAIENECTHQGGPLNEGELKGYGLKCPWHYAVFDVRNGKVSDSTVWASNLISYPVKIDEANGDIFINPNGSKL